jgi:hypothetical protein
MWQRPNSSATDEQLLNSFFGRRQRALATLSVRRLVSTQIRYCYNDARRLWQQNGIQYARGAVKVKEQMFRKA